MTKFKLKGQWDEIRHDDCKILETFVDEIEDKSTVRCDDDIIELEFEIKKITRRESRGGYVDLEISKVEK